jgi:hypothetical protein
MLKHVVIRTLADSSQRNAHDVAIRAAHEGPRRRAATAVREA